MKIRDISLKALFRSLLAFSVFSLLLVVSSAWYVSVFFDGVRVELQTQAEASVEFSQSLDQSLIPINSKLYDVRRLIGGFSSELALLSIDDERSFDDLEGFVVALSKNRDILNEYWPEGLLPTSMLERISSNIIISEEIALEVLERRSSNYTYRLYEESVEIIEQLQQDTDKVLEAVSNKLAALSSKSHRAVGKSKATIHEKQQSLKFGITLFTALTLILFSVIVVMIFVFMKEILRRLKLLRSFAQSIEQGDYSSSVDLLAVDESGDLARSLESMSSRLVELIVESEQLAESADESSKAKSEFLASMSHEIRTPMNGVIGLLDILSSSKLDAQQRKYLQLAQSSANSLLGLINDILDFSKIESGKLEIECVDFDVSDLISDFTAVMQQAAKDKSLVLKSEMVGFGGHSWVKGDPSRLRQILTNLVGNALKFTHDGEVLVNVEFIDAQEDVSLRIAVRDTGIGIPKSRINSLFESFTQVDASTTRKYGGTGLGLTISNQLVQLMGADALHVESEENVGSCFWFELPVERTDTPPETSVDCLVAGVGQGDIGDVAPLQEKPKVLLVEDNAVNQLVAQTLIEAEGFEVDIASNGQEALDALNAPNNQFCMVFMDCQMPIKDGYQAASAIRAGEAGAQASNIPIVAMTANAMEGDKQKCLGAGMDDYISKPIDATLLSTALIEWSPIEVRSPHSN